MKSLTLFCTAIVLVALPSAAQAKIHRVVEKTFAVQPGGLLTVETQGGNVTVQTSSGSEVKVVAKQTINAGSDKEADVLLQRLNLTIEQREDGIFAKSTYEKKRSSGFNWGSWPPVNVSFVVTVPEQYNVKLQTSGGDIAIRDLNGEIHARTSGGNISMGKIAGKIDANTSGGDVQLVSGGAAVRIGTSGGNIDVQHAVGVADLDTSGGDIKIGTVESAIHASTSGGNVTADSITSLKNDCEFGTSGGDVRVVVAQDAAFFLDASTSGGEVRASDLKIAIEKGGSGKGKLVGRVNGGGARLKLHSSGGNVTIDTR